MKRRRMEDADPPADDAALVSIFLSARQQADLHLPPFEVEGEAIPDVADAPAD